MVMLRKYRVAPFRESRVPRPCRVLCDRAGISPIVSTDTFVFSPAPEYQNRPYFPSASPIAFSASGAIIAYPA